MRETRHADADIRAFLERMAGEAPVEPVGIAPAVRRARRRIAVVWVGSVLVVSLVAAGVGSIWDRMDGAYVPRPAEPRPVYVPSDLPALVLSTEAEVARVLGNGGLARPLHAFRSREVHPSFLEKGFALDAEGLRAAGLRRTFIGWFATRGFDQATGGTTLISLAMLFVDETAADRGLEVISTDRDEDWAIARSTPTTDLGQEGWFVDGRFRGSPTLAIVWRSGNLVLFVASEGHFTPEEFSSLAGEVDRRARSAG
jgi:hypothetical protein